jgi:hypothetical protein
MCDELFAFSLSFFAILNVFPSRDEMRLSAGWRHLSPADLFHDLVDWEYGNR